MIHSGSPQIRIISVLSHSKLYQSYQNYVYTKQKKFGPPHVLKNILDQLQFHQEENISPHEMAHPKIVSNVSKNCLV